MNKARHPTFISSPAEGGPSSLKTAHSFESCTTLKSNAFNQETNFFPLAQWLGKSDSPGLGTSSWRRLLSGRGPAPHPHGTPDTPDANRPPVAGRSPWSHHSAPLLPPGCSAPDPLASPHPGFLLPPLLFSVHLLKLQILVLLWLLLGRQLSRASRSLSQ